MDLIYIKLLSDQSSFSHLQNAVSVRLDRSVHEIRYFRVEFCCLFVRVSLIFLWNL